MFCVCSASRDRSISGSPRGVVAAVTKEAKGWPLSLSVPSAPVFAVRITRRVAETGSKGLSGVMRCNLCLTFP